MGDGYNKVWCDKYSQAQSFDWNVSSYRYLYINADDTNTQHEPQYKPLLFSS